MTRIVAIVTILAFLCCIPASLASQGQKQGGAAQKQTQPAKQVTDPVCGMSIDSTKAAGKSEYKGTTYYFCSAYCKKTFDADPEAVLRKQGQKKKM